jgi:hypothetical protein
MAEDIIKGLDDVMKNLNREIKKIEGKTMAGLVKAMAVVRKDMGKTPPLVPVDTRNLDQSWFVSPLASGLSKPLIQAGFSANYAMWVHENMEAKFQRPGAGPKFFEAALNRNHKAILEAIRGEIKLT